MNTETNTGQDSCAADPSTDPSCSSGVFMACCYQSNRLGIASFHQDAGEIQVMQAVDESDGPLAFQASKASRLVSCRKLFSGNFHVSKLFPMIDQMLQLAKLHADPVVLYISSKSDEAFIAAAKQPIHPQGEETCVRFERSSIFKYEQAIRWLQSLHVQGMLSDAKPQDRLHWLNAHLNLSARQQVQAAGALIAIMQKEGLSQSGVEASEEGGMPSASFTSVERIAEASMSGYLMIDPLTLRGLQIFQEERHPSAMGIGRAKEGFSVFGMFNRCLTGMGRQLLRLWFLRPLVNLDVINDRLDTIETLISHSDAMHTIREIIKPVTEVPKLLSRLQSLQGKPDIKDFHNLCESMNSLLQLKATFQELAGQQDSDTVGVSETMEEVQINPWKRLNITHKILAHITDDLGKCRSLVNNVIDFSSPGEGMMIASGVCQELDKLKHMYHGLPDLLTKVVESELKSVPRELSRACSQQLWSIVYVPQVGYLVQICGQPLGADVLDSLPDYSQAFESTGDDGSPVYYYKCDCTDHLNARFGDMLNKIYDMENSLCAELVGRLTVYKAQLQWACGVCAEVDCLSALALCAKEGAYTRPTVTRENIINIKNGRHVLTEMLVDTYIPNSTSMSNETGRIHVITGPNASGKSCYMKQVALIVFLSHVGCFVPADQCTVGLTDRIFSRVRSLDQEGDCQDSKVNKSTFMVDLTQVAMMMKLATPRSLLIIDEFGKGTLTSDGVGLLCSMLHWWAVQPDPPRVLACTHFSEVLDEEFLPRCPQLQFLTMHVVTESKTNKDGSKSEFDDAHVLLYKLVQGYSTPSFGVHCAHACGLPTDVVQRAIKIIKAHSEKKTPPPFQDAQLENRNQVCIELTRTLASLDLEDDQAVIEFLEKAQNMAGTL
ncbi:hypothetical protein BSKO_08137 [Bryopsis sp. KO-2023]|nr:hypothetical protein BSKO_08137 [Bryopsis sp. KO-2023]